jgi:hypothetical protein
MLFASVLSLISMEPTSACGYAAVGASMEHAPVLVLIACLTLGCAEPQARVEPQAQPPIPPRQRHDPCPDQVLGYEDASPVGLSAAEFVAKFGNRRTAPRHRARAEFVVLAPPTAGGGERELRLHPSRAP